MLRKVVVALLVVGLVSSVWVGGVSAAQEKVTVCHKPGTPAEGTLEIAAPALAAHLGHGDYQGPCQGPQSAGCSTLNALVPDPQMFPNAYIFSISDLDFLPAETIHVDLTFTTVGEVFWAALVAVFDSTGEFLAYNGDTQGSIDPGQHTFSVNYVVVAGDDADGAGAFFQNLSDGSITLNSVKFSCTPAS